MDEAEYMQYEDSVYEAEIDDYQPELEYVEEE